MTPSEPAPRQLPLWPLPLAAALLPAVAVALVVYGSFLGSDGSVYRWLRRWGTLMYFGGTYAVMLTFACASQRLHAAGRLALPRGHRRVMFALLAFVAAFCVSHVIAAMVSKELENRIENLTEWWGVLVMTSNFVAIASLWRRWGLGATVGLHRLAPDPALTPVQ
jgi:hypothetical protein